MSKSFFSSGKRTSEARLGATDASLEQLPEHEAKALDELRIITEKIICELTCDLPECDSWRRLGKTITNNNKVDVNDDTNGHGTVGVNGDCHERDDRLRDLILLRFLRYNALSVEKSRDQMNEALKWRAKTMVANLSEDILKGMKVGIPMVHIANTIKQTSKDRESLYVSFGEGYIRAEVDHAIQETAAGKFFDFILYDEKGPRATHGSIVIDFTNIGLANIDLIALRNGIVIYLNYFPDIFDKIMFINYPRLVYGVWKAVAPLLDPRTKSRVVWLSNGDDMRTRLSESFDMDKIPTWMGGKMECGEDVTLYNGMILKASELRERFK